jgi:hypothetical protein
MGFEETWTAIERHAGETFYQLGGRTFTYRADATSLTTSTTEQSISRHQFERVYRLGEIPSPRRMRQLGIRDGSMIFSILTDPRILQP